MEKILTYHSFNHFKDNLTDHLKLREILEWKTKEGKLIKINELSDNHLKNILNISQLKFSSSKLFKFLELELVYRFNNDEHVSDYPQTYALNQDYVNFFKL